jgi:hypothetical protein
VLNASEQLQSAVSTADGRNVSDGPSENVADIRGRNDHDGANRNNRTSSVCIYIYHIEISKSNKFTVG